MGESQSEVVSFFIAKLGELPVVARYKRVTACHLGRPDFRDLDLDTVCRHTALEPELISP